MPHHAHTLSKFWLATASVATLSLALPGIAQAQILSGNVTDVTGEAPFEGAVITLDETGRSVTTDRFGRYRMTNLTPGTYDVTVTYLGARPVTQTITLPESGATLDFQIGDDVRYEDNVIVVGTRAAQANALNQQRNSDSIISVIDSDGLGYFPDTTVADSLQRVVGLSIETDQGEGRYVSIRGVNTDLISASISEPVAMPTIRQLIPNRVLSAPMASTPQGLVSDQKFRNSEGRSNKSPESSIY